jgi:hypothetical protein
MIVDNNSCVLEEVHFWVPHPQKEYSKGKILSSEGTKAKVIAKLF